MKKILLVFLCLLVCFSSAAAFAESAEDSDLSGKFEVKFRGIEFGTAGAEFQQKLAAGMPLSSMPSSPEANLTCYVSDIIVNGDHFTDTSRSTPDAQYAVLHKSISVALWSQSISKLAYHPFREAAAVFVRPVADGRIVEDDEQAIFYAAYYTFDDDAMPDLLARMTYEYGEPESMQDACGNTFAVWKEANDTEIAIYGNRLVYAWRGAEALIEQALAAEAAHTPSSL